MKSCVPAIILFLSVLPLCGQNPKTPTFETNVDMVLLSFSVENSGRPVRNLQLSDLEVLEDGVAQRITDFVTSRSSEVEQAHRVPMTIFVLVDTSNAMYNGYAYACDAIAQFLRGLDPEDYAAVYTFSRNVSKATPPTRDRYVAMAGLQSAAAGDDTALYNSLLLTLRDAEKLPGPKKVVVFSNGADNASMVSPDDVARVAEDAGIPIYVVSTQFRDEIAVNVWSRITRRTGGSAYFALEWSMQADAFRAIAQEIRDAYTVAYYSTSTKPGFRKLDVRIRGKKYAVRCRPGYSAPARSGTRLAKTHESSASEAQTVAAAQQTVQRP
jgi:VWFA-related protein